MVLKQTNQRRRKIVCSTPLRNQIKKLFNVVVKQQQENAMQSHTTTPPLRMRGTFI